ncbi:MAG: alpha-amylase family glycosyl hydrolase, partial [Bacteroidota bacterium]
MQKVFLLLMIVALTSCQEKPTAITITPTPAPVKASSSAPEWSKNVNIYEVNIRQTTSEGTFNAFTDQRMEEVASLGVDVLWLMPVYPISETKRKGTLGSYYAVSDFAKPNPEFGTEEDLQRLIDRAHELGMKVIFDFVPNHTGWDHVWLQDHKDWYTQDEEGNVIDPIDPSTGESWGWTDVADLNHDNPEMRAAMINDLVYWLEEFDLDGYRMDVAHQVPDVFWAEATPKLRAANPDVFMLAEAEIPRQRNQQWFAMDYGWSFHHLINGIARGEESAEDIKEWYAKDAEAHQYGWHMNFITNHDENSWSGTVEERMGDNWAPMAVLVSTIEGAPLIYSGQEAGLNRRLEFFEKDSIDFSDKSRYPFYTALNELKHDNQALWNGAYGGKTTFIDYEGDHDKTIVYYRAREENAVG